MFCLAEFYGPNGAGRAQVRLITMIFAAEISPPSPFRSPNHWTTIAQRRLVLQCKHMAKSGS
jgi:hypothetical protein